MGILKIVVVAIFAISLMIAPAIADEKHGKMGEGMMMGGMHEGMRNMHEGMMGMMKEMMGMMKEMTHTPTDAQKKRLDEMMKQMDEMMKMHGDMMNKKMEKHEEMKKEKMKGKGM